MKSCYYVVLWAQSGCTFLPRSTIVPKRWLRCSFEELCPPYTERKDYKLSFIEISSSMKTNGTRQYNSQTADNMIVDKELSIC